MSAGAASRNANLVAPNLSLVVLAGGMGSRFGGNKQLALIGDTGRTLLHFSVMDAYQVGVRHLVLVIREALQPLFVSDVLPYLPNDLKVDFVYQQMTDLPEVANSFNAKEMNEMLAQRQKPWGTAHALWSARKVLIDRSLIVINADDYYGAEAMQLLALHFQTQQDWAMVAFPITATLSEFGGVNRGVCTVSAGTLQQVTEWTEITRDESGQVHGVDAKGVLRPLAQDSAVSMNIWGFGPNILAHLEQALTQFLQQKPSAKAECYLPAVVDAALVKGQQLKVYLSSQSWYGVTYPQDLVKLAKHFGKLSLATE